MMVKRIVSKHCLECICGVLFLLILTGCGTTLITIENNSNYGIYKNGQFIGKGQASIRRLGTPRKIVLTAQDGGREVGSLIVRRHFDGVTLLAGLFTYYTGFFWAWRYPRELVIPLRYDESKPRKSWDTWEGNKNSRWDK